MLRILIALSFLNCVYATAEIPAGWDCQYTKGSPVILKVRNTCESGCSLKPVEKMVASGSVKCSKEGFTDVYTVVGCRVLKAGLLSANECGNASALGIKDPVGVVNPKIEGLTILPEGAAKKEPDIHE
jgi:hypothetical protein